MLRLSYIIPCYNMERYLPACLDSLLDQGLTADEYEVIVVNDESADRTLEIANEYAGRHVQIKVINKKNAGVGAARNSGFDQAGGAYVYFLDPDDYLARDCMPLVLDKAEENDLDILTFVSSQVGPDEKRPETSSDKETVRNTDLKVLDGPAYVASRKFKNEIWWFIVRREFMLDGGFRFIEGKWMEDAILSAQMLSTAPKVAHLDFDMHRYRILPTSAMRNKSPEHYRKVIFDNANAAAVYYELMETLDRNHPEYQACRQRLKTRQQSFVFFLLVRLMKSDIPDARIPQMLQEFEKIDAYPLDRFLGKDYHGISYSILVNIFNRKALIRPFVKFFRLFYRLAS